jgi:hypothetical protein
VKERFAGRQQDPYAMTAGVVKSVRQGPGEPSSPRRAVPMAVVVRVPIPVEASN